MPWIYKFLFWIMLWLSIIVADIVFPVVISNSTFQITSFCIGIILILYGLILNAVAGKTLKKFAHLDLKKGDKKPKNIVTEGIFSCMRHPAMFGSILFSIGLAFIGGKLLTILWAGWVGFFGLYFIMSIEEKKTLQLFGEEYCNFIRDRKPFSFSIKCIIKGIKFLKNPNNT